MAAKTVMGQLLAECSQAHNTRKALYEELETEFKGRAVVSYCTSFNQPVIIDDVDVDIIEHMLQAIDLSKGLSLIISSRGGSGLAAERIIQVCRSYSKDNFETIVPRMAKSAATMVCFGSNKIHMSETSDLGPIDPQIIMGDKQLSAHSIISSYEDLMNRAIKNKGNLEPFLQQLGQYRASEITAFKASQFVATDIAIQALKTGMMSKRSRKTIEKLIKPFTDASLSGSHGRRIGIELGLKAGLKIEKIDLASKAWHLLWELYTRTDWCTRNSCSKLVECKSSQFTSSSVRQ